MYTYLLSSFSLATIFLRLLIPLFCMQRVMGLVAGLDLNCAVTSLSFSSSGSMLLIASKQTNKVFLYQVAGGSLLSVFVLTNNRLLDGIRRELNSKFIADDGK